MVKPLEPSALMVEALDLAISHGGTLVRFGEDRWSFPGAPRGARGLPEESVGTASIQGLVRRDMAVYSDFRFHRGARRPVAVKVNPLN